MKVLWRQLVKYLFWGVCLCCAFIYGTYWGVKNHSELITNKDWLELERLFQNNCPETAKQSPGSTVPLKTEVPVVNKN